MTAPPTVHSGERWQLTEGDALAAYPTWPAPDVIVADGPYGLGGYFGDPESVDSLPQLYRPHVQAWTDAAHPGTALWFWNTELGWATVHPLLREFGWQYVQTVVWDKGIGHAAGNVNGQTIRRFPTVTEVAVLYARPFTMDPSGAVSAQDWMRAEWRRTGLPFAKANEACGVANAASRKFLTGDHLWYCPPPEMMARLVAYANEYGDPAGRPYFALDGAGPVTEADWAEVRGDVAYSWPGRVQRRRYPWRHVHGVTNVWQHPPLHSSERVRGGGARSAPRAGRATARSATHLNQKPLALMRRSLRAVTTPDAVVWEPFGGLASGSVAALGLGCRTYAAELNPAFAQLAVSRLSEQDMTLPGLAVL